MQYIVTVAVASALLFIPGCMNNNNPDLSLAGNKTVVEALAENGFGQIAERVESMKMTSIRLEGLQGKSGTQPGQSRIGGVPDLPQGTAWPVSDGQSLSFISQINLRDVTSILPESALPETGILYFFYDSEQSVWGFDPKDKGKWAVLYSSEAPEQTRNTEFPSDLPDYSKFMPVAVQPILRDDYPDYSQVDMEDFNLSDLEDDKVFEVFQAFSNSDKSVHKLFGYPDQIQGDMQTECQLAYHGLYVGDETGYKDPRARELSARAAQWKLLLQIDTDDAAGMMWGDVGRIYYWIRAGDLAERNFHNSWLILQCY